MSLRSRNTCQANISLPIDTQVPHTEKDIYYHTHPFCDPWLTVSLPCKHPKVATCGRECLGSSYCDSHIDWHYCHFKNAVTGDGSCQATAEGQKVYTFEEYPIVKKFRPECKEKSKKVTCPDCEHCYCKKHYAVHKCAFL